MQTTETNSAVGAGGAVGKEEKRQYQYSNGCSYDGMWVGNRRHGQGVFTWPSGAKFEGAFEHDRRHGQGKISYANGDNYDGDWKNDQRNGN